MNVNVVISNPYRDCASATRCFHPRTLTRPYLMHMSVSQQRWCGGLLRGAGPLVCQNPRTRQTQFSGHNFQGCAAENIS